MNALKKIVKQFIGRELAYHIQEKCNKEYLGSDYGGWYICPDKLNQDSIVYSFGIGEDISFDLEMIRKFGLNIYAFDPTPKSIEWLKQQNLPSQFSYYQYGISAMDGVVDFFPPDNPEHVSHTLLQKESTKEKAFKVKVFELKTIINMLGHDHIDILKMDIEGAEYEVVENILKLNVDISQILIEFHHRFPGLGVKFTKKTIKMLNRYGYKIFAICQDGEEYSFIKQG